MIMRCSFSKQTNNHGLYTAAQGELRERGERMWDGTVRHGNVVIFLHQGPGNGTDGMVTKQCSHW